MRTRAVLLVLLATLLATAGCGLIGSARPDPSPSPAPVPQTIVVPAVTGKRLTEAAATLKSHGFDKVAYHDSVGDRIVLEPNNWLVTKQTPAAGAKVARDTEVTLDVAKPTDGVGPGSVQVGVLPDVRCMELQAAQDKLQEAGFLLLTSKDALGDRHQVLDRDWVVIGQSPDPGRLTLPTTRVTLTVVKYGEPTGDSGCRS
ncbi:beta-lactam-binding protein with PASTA domain [Hamadaea flava]|uniref:PASTA domain-containing protein n=1 Tax=Hamadaea flava TaxID=1742688 RepID=A0ABV8LQ16_9ACTN|nr:PASTA domain-containing protein [Hamadaea flava]MCP2322547.1 beta-lactam-binding protein with PASTA domain [Hamadaea flava]